MIDCFKWDLFFIDPKVNDIVVVTRSEPKDLSKA